MWQVRIVLKRDPRPIVRRLTGLTAARLTYLTWLASPCVRSVELVSPEGAVVLP